MSRLIGVRPCSENVRKIRDLFKYDCLRANKSTMAWGVEARVPFLDKVRYLEGRH